MKSTMTIGRKLFISIGSMVVLMAVMGITALYSIDRLNDELETATRKTARILQIAGSIEKSASDLLAGMRGIVLFTFAKEPSRVETSKQQVDAAANIWQKSIDEIMPLIAREDGRTIVN